MAAAGGGVLFDGATTYCWASNASTTAAYVDAASFGALGKGNGGTCPVWVSLNLNRTYAAGASPTISWAMLMLDPSSSSSWAPFALNNITQNVTTSQLFYCPTDNAGDDNCRPFRSTAKPLSSPIFAQSFQQKSVMFSSSVEMPSTPGKYIVFATTTLPAAKSTITSNRLDVALFTSIMITQTGQGVDDPSSASSHTALHVGLGVGGAVLVIGIVIWCCYTRRRLRQLEVELHRATLATNSLPRSLLHGHSASGHHHLTPRLHLDSHTHHPSLPKLSFSTQTHQGLGMSDEGVDGRQYHRGCAVLDPLPPRLHIPPYQDFPSHHEYPRDHAGTPTDYILNPRLSSSEYFYPQHEHHLEASHRRHLPRNSDHFTRPTAFFDDDMSTFQPYWRHPTTPSDTSTDYSTQPQYFRQG